MADALRDGNGTPTMMIKDSSTGEIKPLDTSMLTPPTSTTAWGEITGEITDQEDLQSALGGKVAGNTAITGATKTKITYDAKGLVTGGADATTADIADSTDKRYVTDAQKTVIGNTSGTNTGDNATNSQYSGLAALIATGTPQAVTITEGAGTVITRPTGYHYINFTAAISATTALASTMSDGDAYKIDLTFSNAVTVTFTGVTEEDGTTGFTYTGASGETKSIFISRTGARYIGIA